MFKLKDLLYANYKYNSIEIRLLQADTLSGDIHFDYCDWDGNQLKSVGNNKYDPELSVVNFHMWLDDDENNYNAIIWLEFPPDVQ